MAKYLIQDIIPPDRNNKPHRIREEEGAHHHAPEHSIRLTSSSIPAHKKPTRLSPRHHTEGVRESEGEERLPLHQAQIERDQVELTPKHASHTTPKYFDDQLIKQPERTSGRMVHQLHGPVTREDNSSFLRNWLPWIFGVCGFTAIVLFAMNYFGGATITVTPKKDSIPMDQKVTAFKSPASTELAFAVMKVSLEETKEVPATGEKTLTAKASGKIIIYNKQTSTQRLIKNTRFQSPAGKIYRINDSVNVPKQTTVKGKTVPGSIEVTVFADEAGPDFNTQATDFTLPGLKGSPAFDKVYGRGKGPMAGGASGTIKSVTDADMKVARDELRVQLETKLRTKARSDLAPSQISYDNGIVVELEEAVLTKTEASSADKAVVAQKGTLYMVTFDKELLTKSIVGLLVQTYKGESVNITNLEALTLEMPAMTGADLWERDRLDFALRGNPSLEWSIDEMAIKKALYGVPRDSFLAIMAQFPTIENAEADLTPAWKRSFPEGEDDIEVKVVAPK